MKKTLTVFAVLFLFVAAFSQTTYTVNNTRTPGNSLAIQNTPGTNVFLMQNPVSGMIRFQLSNPVDTKYEISLYSTGGQKITSIPYNHPRGTSTKTMTVPAGVHGMHYLVVRSQSEKFSIKVFIQ